MPVRFDQVPLSTVKNWSKSLKKELSDLLPQTPRISLAITQEALARVLGHNNWHDLQLWYGAMDKKPFIITNDFLKDDHTNLHEKNISDDDALDPQSINLTDYY